MSHAEHLTNELVSCWQYRKLNLVTSVNNHEEDIFNTLKEIFQAVKLWILSLRFQAHYGTASLKNRPLSKL